MHTATELLTGADVLLESLQGEDVRHVFGNPGSTELPLIDALAGLDELDYVLGLQEATVLAMADGYAQATRRPAFVNLHTAAGLGNAIGNLTNAQANRAPLVVTAGQQDRRHLASDPLLSGDLVGLAGPVTKGAHEVRNGEELGTQVRRAFQDARTPPAGPVFLSLPMDLLGEAAAPPPARSERLLAARPPDDLLDRLAATLAETAPNRLAIVAGDEGPEVASAMVDLAEALGAPVFGSPIHGTLVFPPGHPLWAGALYPLASSIRDTLAEFERVLLVGGQAFLTYPYSPGSPLPDGAELIHLSSEAGQLGRAHPTDMPVAADPLATLDALIPRVRGLVGDGSELPVANALAARQAALKAQVEQIGEDYELRPVRPACATEALSRALPAGGLIVDEAVTTGLPLRDSLTRARPGEYYFCRGGGLGWGMPAAAGVSLAHGGEPVLCVVGDGAAMYSPQALWTAARERLPVVFVVVNNRQYLILKNFLRSTDGPAARADEYPGMDLDDPPVDFVALAASMGVPATRVDGAPELEQLVGELLRDGKTHLVEVPVTA